MTERKKRFIVAAYRVAPNKGDRFNVHAVGASIGMTPGEADDIARELHTTDDPPVLVRMGQGEATLASGRELARAFIEEEQAREAQSKADEDARKAADIRERRAKIERIIWGAIVGFLTLIVIPLVVNHFDRKIERMEEEHRKQQEQQAPPAAKAQLPPAPPPLSPSTQAAP